MPVCSQVPVSAEPPVDIRGHPVVCCARLEDFWMRPVVYCARLLLRAPGWPQCPVQDTQGLKKRGVKTKKKLMKHNEQVVFLNRFFVCS